MSSFLDKGVQPISENNLENSARLIVHALGDVLRIDPRVVEELRAIATIEPETPSLLPETKQKIQRNMSPCERCRQRRQKVRFQ